MHSWCTCMRLCDLDAVIIFHLVIDFNVVRFVIIIVLDIFDYIIIFKDFELQCQLHYMHSTILSIIYQHLDSQIYAAQVISCYDPSYAPMLVAMLVAMLMTIAGRSPLGYRVVPRPTLFRVSLCSPESYR